MNGTSSASKERLEFIAEKCRRVGPGGAQWFTEWLATFALVVTILAGLRFAQASVPWLTASTSFADPSHAH
jgi:hypothetical protein